MLLKGKQKKLGSLLCSSLSVASMSNDPIREWILSEGKASQITRISPVGGGCINLASRYDTDAGSFFVKTNRYKHELHGLFFFWVID